MTSPSHDPKDSKGEIPQEASATPVSPESGQELSEEALAKQQEAYRQAYLLQLRRMSCPGCGDDGIIPE